MLLRTLRLGALRQLPRALGPAVATSTNALTGREREEGTALPTWPPSPAASFSTSAAAAGSRRGRRAGAPAAAAAPQQQQQALVQASKAPTPAPAPPSSPDPDAALAPTPPVRPTAISGDGTPATAAELASALAHPALVVTRDVEWGSVLLGFEQANKYAVRDEAGELVALLFEETSGLASAVGRQVLRRRRSFTATLTTPDGRLLLRVRRPLYFINSKTLVEDAGGTVVGEVVQEWAPLRRKYALFQREAVGGEEGGEGGSDHRVQTLAVDAPFLAWEFPLLGPDGSTRALLDRNFQGFGKELLTDAGRYALHFGFEGPDAKALASGVAALTIAAAHPEAGVAAAEKAAAKDAAGVVLPPSGALVPTSTGGQLLVRDPLSSLTAKSLALALAIAVDFDYFSRHSAGGGGLGGMWPLLLPIPSPPVPIPPPVVDGGGVGSAAGAAGEEAGGAAASEADSAASPGAEEPLERDLGDDRWGGGGGGDGGNGGGGDGDAGWGWEDAGDAGDATGEGGGALGGLWDVARGLFYDD